MVPGNDALLLAILSATPSDVRPQPWLFVGGLSNVQCGVVRDALRSGLFAVAQSELKDLEVGGQRLRTESGCR
jgi:hypothetical protein